MFVKKKTTVILTKIFSVKRIYLSFVVVGNSYGNKTINLMRNLNYKVKQFNSYPQKCYCYNISMVLYGKK